MQHRSFGRLRSYGALSDSSHLEALKVLQALALNVAPFQLFPPASFHVNFSTASSTGRPSNK